jgi:hypothetical protein
MKRKCFICGKESKFLIKGTSDSYCEECAEENFADLSYLITVEEEAKRLKTLIDEQIEEKEIEE